MISINVHNLLDWLWNPALYCTQAQGQSHAEPQAFFSVTLGGRTPAYLSAITACT